MNQNLSQLTYGIVGLGIMGGSIAKAIRTNVLSSAGEGAVTGKIFALDKNNESLYAACTAGVIDQAFTPSETEKMLGQCDVLFICLYPHATLEFLQTHKNHYKDDAVITDISGVKALIQADFNSLCPTNAHLVLGHPMAGGEKEGFAASKGEYFTNHNYIIITQKNDEKNDEARALLEKLVGAMGFTRITKTDSSTHDSKIGFTSQLCHVVASVMVESAEDPEITSFGGGSFEDLTRIAMINAPLWTELFLSNKEKLIAHIETFKKHMNEIEKLIETEDKEGLQSLLQDVREKRIQMQKN